MKELGKQSIVDPITLFVDEMSFNWKLSRYHSICDLRDIEKYSRNRNLICVEVEI